MMHDHASSGTYSERTVDAFEQQVHQYRDRVYGFACYFLKDKVAAQDITQDVFIRFWEHHDDIDTDRALGWLMRVTRNACIDLHRKRKTRRNAVTVNSENVGRAESPAPSPQADAEAVDFQQHLDAALDRIDEPYRSVVAMREIQRLKYKEIAEALDMPINTVKVYIHRGRKKLRHQLSEVLDHETA
ncbi:RNA polymerase sigma factor [Salisaeta longa]|uniref:RNA polymerase sigma factor n=1 Tax=Salisaeta longa TaxID=503170 RepID=UPI0004042E56|nr:RNA polymerase sigma factor [Salisaeta longa]